MLDRDKEVYEAMARKDLSFGCLIFKSRLAKIISKDYPQGYIPEPWNLRYICIDDGENIFTSTLIENTEIIGHPIILSDIFNWQILNSPHSNISEERLKIISFWNLSKPYYEDKSDECKDFIHSLIK